MKTDTVGKRTTAPFVSVSGGKLFALTPAKSAPMTDRRTCTGRSGNNPMTAVGLAVVRKASLFVHLLFAQHRTAAGNLAMLSYLQENAVKSVKRTNVWEREKFTNKRVVLRRVTTTRTT